MPDLTINAPDATTINLVTGAAPVGPVVQPTAPPGNISGNSVAHSGYVDMQAFPMAMFLLSVGQIDTTVDFKLRAAVASDGTGEVDVAGKAITQLTSNDDGKQVVIYMKATELPAGTRYVRSRCTTGATGITDNVGMFALGFPAVFAPGAAGAAAQVIGG
jgi:hypothetical protein